MNPHQPGYVYPPPQQDFPFGYSPYSHNAQVTSYQYPPHLNAGGVPQQPQQQQQQQAQFFPTYRAAPQSVVQPTAPTQALPAPPPAQSQFRPTQAQSAGHVQSSTSTANGAPEAEDGEDDDDDPDTASVNNPSAQQPAGNDENGAPVFNIPPPPEGTYASEEALEKAMHDWSKEHGYELVRRASKRNAQGAMYKRYYHCSKHGKRANTAKVAEENRVRQNRKSGRVDCPMSLAAVAVDPTAPQGAWQIRHRKSHHNHPPMRAIELTGHRRRARMGGVEQAIDGLFAIGTSTAQVLSFLQKTNPEGLFRRSDVANMKNRWKKWGSCADRIQRLENKPSSGRGTACLSCRQKRVACGHERPVCANCQQRGTVCEYDNPPPDQQQQQDGNEEDASMTFDDNNDVGAGVGAADPINLTTPARNTRQSTNNTTTTQPPHPAPPAHANPAQTHQILTALQSFHADHITPTRLTLDSSAVEVLAHSSCGNGDSYKSLPALNTARDWPRFRDAMREASLREGTWDVLTGAKTEPRRPIVPAFNPDLGVMEPDVDVETWNEYIRRLAIHNRRNALLLSALFGNKVGAAFKARMRAHPTAHADARAAWLVLGDWCEPRGSKVGFAAFCEMVGCEVGVGVGEEVGGFAARLEGCWNKLRGLRGDAGGAGDMSGESAGLDFDGEGDAGPDTFLTLLFLRGLAQSSAEWKAWVDGLCLTSNVAGFGTGDRLGWREVIRAAGRKEREGR